MMLNGEKKVENYIFCKWLNFSPIFFSPGKEFITIFFFNYYYYYFLFATFIITLFFYVLYLSRWSKAALTKIFTCEWKQGIEKNNNKDINTTRNCTFLNFKTYATLKTSKRISFKLVLIISRSKEQVFNSFQDFVWFFDCLCYPRWFKAIQN